MAGIELLYEDSKALKYEEKTFKYILEGWIFRFLNSAKADITKWV